MTNSAPVVVIGIDSAEKQLIYKWAADGILPNFQRLLNEGLIGDTTSVPGLYVGATWQCFSTGVTPAGNGVYSWKQLVPGTYRFQLTRRNDHLKRAPFWEVLSDHGRRVAVIDVPYSTPARRLNGIQVVDWGAHAATSAFMTTPTALAERIRETYGEHPARAENDTDRSLAELLAYRDGLLDGIRRKVAMTKDLLAQDNWDLFLEVFTEPHSVGHHLWHLHDPDHPRHDAAAAALHGDPVREVYIAIDRALGDIRAALPEDATIIALLSHGMGPDYGAAHMLDDILLKLGLAAPPPAGSEAARQNSLRRRIEKSLLWVWHRLPPALRSRAKAARNLACRWLDADVAPPSPQVDPAASQCFSLGNLAAHVGIRVNLKGREPAGKIAPGEEYERFCADLTGELLQLVDPDTGRPLVRRVIRSDRIYQGPYLDHLPDLLIEWHYACGTSARVASPRLGEIHRPYRHCRTGDHRPEGLFLAVGAGIGHGRLLRPVSIMDFAPTIAKLLDVELPPGEGSAIRELFASAAPLARAS